MHTYLHTCKHSIWNDHLNAAGTRSSAAGGHGISISESYTVSQHCQRVPEQASCGHILRPGHCARITTGQALCWGSLIELIYIQREQQWDWAPYGHKITYIFMHAYTHVYRLPIMWLVTLCGREWVRERQSKRAEGSHLYANLSLSIRSKPSIHIRNDEFSGWRPLECAIFETLGLPDSFRSVLEFAGPFVAAGGGPFFRRH